MRRKKKFKPRRVDEDVPFSAESLDDRMYPLIQGRNVHRSVFDNITGQGIDIEGSDNIFRNIRIKKPKRKRV